MRSYHAKQTRKLQNELLKARLDKTVAGSPARMTEDNFRQMIGSMSHRDAAKYFREIMPPTTEDDRAALCQKLMPGVKNWIVELLEDILNCYDHDVAQGKIERKDFIALVGMAMTSDVSFRDMLETRGLTRKFRLTETGYCTHGWDEDEDEGAGPPPPP